MDDLQLMVSVARMYYPQGLKQEEIATRIAWGRTCHAFMSRYAARGFLQGTQVIPMIGGSNRNLERCQLNEMVRPSS